VPERPGEGNKLENKMALNWWGDIRSSMARAVPRVIVQGEEIKYDEMGFQ
jgi:hypothetical protein